MKRLGAVALILIGLAIPSSADEFGTIVKSIESHYDVHQTDPHLIGFALFLAIPGIWEGGMDELKIASFKNEKRTLEPSLPELSRIMAKSLSPKWRPFLRLSSREKKTATAIYVEPAGKTIRMMIALIERNEIGVVQMELDAKDIKRLAGNLGGKTKEVANLH